MHSEHGSVYRLENEQELHQINGSEKKTCPGEGLKYMSGPIWSSLALIAPGGHSFGRQQTKAWQADSSQTLQVRERQGRRGKKGTKKWSHLPRFTREEGVYKNNMLLKRNTAWVEGQFVLSWSAALRKRLQEKWAGETEVTFRSTLQQLEKTMLQDRGWLLPWPWAHSGGIWKIPNTRPKIARQTSKERLIGSGFLPNRTYPMEPEMKKGGLGEKKNGDSNQHTSFLCQSAS